MTGKLFVFHGHFYQPPRENPWTGLISREQDAAPFHDWNARIDAECYRPNAYGRIADEQHRVSSVTNNYQHMSFNIGPTLLSWLLEHDPSTLRRIVEADELSARENDGHGNAIAQAYNHVILPLADARDRATQIEWGLAFFRFHFGREAEAMWLPETAASHQVLDELIERDLRYVILAPQQAGRVRPLEGGKWTLVRDGEVDTSRPCLYRHRDGSGRSLAVFFYDGALAHGISFGDALGKTTNFLKSVREADLRRGDGPLIHAATDGETAGHHNAWGDRVLADVLTRALGKEGIQVTNYGAVLDIVPPAQEVELDLGADGEGSSWSCAHGVGRWTRDCGCSIAHTVGWNQRWRSGLRSALDLLRDAARPWFEAEAARLFTDPWAARNDYVQLLLNPSGEQRERFMATHAPRPLNGAEVERGLVLMEMQHQLMLMYTSCGWFFDDLTGLEGRQVLRYAARALELWEESGGTPPTEAFLHALAGADSNHPERGNGAGFFREILKRDSVDPRQVLAFALLRADHEGTDSGPLGEWHYEIAGRKRHETEHNTLLSARVRIRREPTGLLLAAGVAIQRVGELGFTAHLKMDMGVDEFSAAQLRLGAARDQAGELSVATQDFDDLRFEPATFLSDAGRELLAPLFDDSYRRFRGTVSELLDRHQLLLRAGLGRGEVELLRDFSRSVLQSTLRHELDRVLEQGAEAAPLAARIAAAREDEVDISLESLRPGVEAMIENCIDMDRLPEARRAITVAGELRIPLHLHRAQERWLERAPGFRDRKTAQELGEDLHLAPALCEAALAGKPWELQPTQEPRS